MLGLIAGSAILWLLLSGHYSALLLSLGAASIGATVYVSHRLEIDDREGVPLHMLLRAPRYITWLFFQMAKSNLEVARRIIQPGRGYAPTMARLQPEQSTELGQTVLANSITLTPGTVTVALTNGVAEIHALTPKKAEKLMAGEMARHVRALETGHMPDKPATNAGSS